MEHRYLLQLVVVTLTFATQGQSATRPDDRTPSCTYNAGLLSCYYLDSSNMDLLEQALRETVGFVLSFGVEITYSDGPSIPLDVFRGYNLTSLTLGGDNFTQMPYELLSGVGAMLTALTVDNEVFDAVELTTPDMLLPFSEFLQQLDISLTNIQKLDQSTFTQYINLEELRLNDNAILAIGLEFVGLHAMKRIYLNTNNISSIETGAFRDFVQLQYLELSENGLSTLQEDAFIGLETSPIIDVGLKFNPWNCTCDLQWLKDWLNDRNLTESSGAQCAYPIQADFNDFTFC